MEVSSLGDLLQMAAGARNQTSHDISASSVISRLNDTLSQYGRKTFARGDLVTYISGNDERPEYIRHVPMIVIRMRDHDRPEDNHTADGCKASNYINDVLVIAVKGNTVVDIGWTGSAILRPWTEELGEELRLFYAGSDEGQRPS